MQPVLLPDSATKQRCELICIHFKTCSVFLLNLISNLFGNMLGEFDNNDYILEKMRNKSIEYVGGLGQLFFAFWEWKYLQYTLLYILAKLSAGKKFHKICI